MVLYTHHGGISSISYKKPGDRMNSDQSYWLVGASWDGVDHQDKKFVDNKIWVLGYKEKKMMKVSI